MDLFNGKNFQTFLAPFCAKLKNEIENFSDEEIVFIDFQEWVNHLSEKYCVDPIVLYEENIEKNITRIKVKKANRFHGFPDEKDYFEMDGVRISYKIPFGGDPDLFSVQPSSRILTRFKVNNFIRPYKDECGSFTLDFEYIEDELKSNGDTMLEYVQNNFENEFSKYKTMVNNVNSEIASYNDSLPNTVMQLLVERKKSADSFSAISTALQIPLTVSKNAPNITPIPLKRVMRHPAARPAIKLAKPEPYICDSDYTNINKIIFMCGTTMEKTARTYYANNEEELRDHLLATLNTHYEAATGETFRKLGKTDILIEFENKAAFIGECKIWHGEKMFQDAVQQIFSYSTWRDSKVSVIIFNKENQSFQSILSKIQNWINENTVSHTRPETNVWNCKYYRKDMNMDVQLTILAFDLYVDKNQFKDVRYEK